MTGVNSEFQIKQAHEYENSAIEGTRESYHFISLKVNFLLMQLRKKLIKMTCEDGVTVYKACKRLKINYSTGKSIIKSYKEKGRVFTRKSERIENGTILPPAESNENAKQLI
jgi:hypothetical protein